MNIPLKISYIIAFSVGAILFIFSLISGTEEFGGGISGIIKNSPNALPWVLFLLIIAGSIRWKKAGALILAIYSFGILYFFNFSGQNFFPATFLLTSLLVIASLIILYFAITQKK